MIFRRFDDRIELTMVLKEDVFLWFKHLDATNRLSVMYGLLNMCLPVELRFLGNCLEDLCKKDFLVMREREIKGNNISEVQKLTDVNVDGVRTQLIVAVALLQVSNRSCAATIFNTLIAWATDLDAIVGDDGGRSSRIVTELHLLMNMALMHPAFTFEQKRILEVHLRAIEDRYSGLLLNVLSGVENDFVNKPIFYQPPIEPFTMLPQEKDHCHCNCVDSVGTLGSNQNIVTGLPLPNSVEVTYPTTTCCVITNRDSTPSPKVNSCPAKSVNVSAGSPKAQIKFLELKNSRPKKKALKGVEYRIQVTWSNGEVTEIYKTHQELCKFHQQLISNQDDLGHKDRYIPYFTGPKPFVGNKIDDPTDEGMGKMADYLRQLMVKVPHHLLDSEFVTKFFRGHASPLSTTNVGSTAKLDSESGEGLDQVRVTGTFSTSSSSLSSSSSISLPASPPPTSIATTMLNNCIAENTVDSVDAKMKSLTIYNSHHNVEGVPVNMVVNSIQTHHSAMNVVSRENVEDTPHFQLNKDLEDLRKIFDTNEILNLTEADLLGKGYEAKKAKQIISRLENFRLQFQHNGLVYYDVELSNCDVTSPPPPVVLQSPCNAVHPVQNHIFMPKAPLDFVLNYSMAPMGYVDVDRGGIHTPTDIPAPVSPAERFMCNGSVDRVESPQVISGTGLIQPAPKGFEVGGLTRQQTVNGGRSSGHQRPGNKGRTANRKESLTSLKQNVQDSNKTVGPANELSEVSPSLNLPNVTICGEGDGNFTSTSTDNSHLIGKGVPSFTATTSVTYSLSQQQQQQQVIGSHQQQQVPLHMAGCINTMTVPRLPTRPTSLTNPICPCSRAAASPLPPTLSHMNYFVPFVYTGFNPPPGGQTSYIATHATNGYAAHPSVQPPNFYTTLQTDCLSTEMSMPGGITNRFPMQQSGGNVVTQPPPLSMVARTNVQHTSMPPPSSVPGFLTGPTPNVGFHGNQISVQQVATQFSLCGGINPSIPTYVIASPNVRLKQSCYNCGRCGHQGTECNETTMDEANRGSHFRLSYHPEDINVDGCD